MRWIAAEQLRAFDSEGTSAHRVGSSPAAWVERFGDDMLINAPGDAAALVGAFDDWAAAAGYRARRVFFRQLVKQPGSAGAPALLRGDRDAPLQTVVTERGLRYRIDFAAGYSVGLFCDQRENRRRLRALRPRRVLNTFAYTCAFSVAAAIGGAETLSVDLSKKSLDWGKENFRLNALDPGGRRFLADDVFAVLPRLARRGEKFDAIILDPPTFSRGAGGKIFRVEDDFSRLIGLAAQCADDGAEMLLSTNAREMTVGDLEATAKGVLPAVTFHRAGMPVEFGRGEGAATTWVVLRR
jgi:23S rRNA (cytosine1962-C5)-methyltransferase